MEEIVKLENTEALVGTSFHDDIIETSANRLTELFGTSEGPSGDGKVLNEWSLLYKADSEEIPFALYDWKEYDGYNENDIIEFHIGTHTHEESYKVFEYLKKIL